MRMISALLVALFCTGAFAASEENSMNWRIVTERDSAYPVVHLVFTFESGSLSDPQGMSGLAHITARALLRGTQTRPAKDLTDGLERYGKLERVEVGATRTTFEFSGFLSNLDFLLDILRDVFTQPAFDIQETITLQNLIQGELRSSISDTDEIGRRALRAALYKGTAAELPVLGTVAGIGKISPKDMKAFFDAHYTLDNLVIGVSSSLEDAEITRRLKSKLDILARGKRVALPFPDWTLKGKRAFIVPKTGLEASSLLFASPGVSAADVTALPLEVANFVFGGDFTSRLSNALRGDTGWTYGSRAGYTILQPWESKPTSFVIDAVPLAEHVADSIRAIWAEWQKFAAAGLSAEDLDYASNAVSKNFPNKIETPAQRVRAKVLEYVTGRPAWTSDAYSSAVEGADLASVNATVKSAFPLDQVAIVIVGDPAVARPALAEIPGLDSIEAVEVNP